jgi:hypothetical protein
MTSCKATGGGVSLATDVTREAMAAPRAADDFANIRARMEELRLERMRVAGEHTAEADEDHRARGGSHSRVFGLMHRRGRVEVIVAE